MELMSTSSPVNFRLSDTAQRIAKRVGRHLGNLPLRATIETVLREIDRLQNLGEFPRNSILFAPGTTEKKNGESVTESHTLVKGRI
jgi:hypothetical protein